MALHLPGAEVVAIGNSSELAEALSALAAIPPGEVIELKASEQHTIRTKRDDDYRIVTAKCPGWWFRQPLTTGDWIDPAGRAPSVLGATRHLNRCEGSHSLPRVLRRQEIPPRR
ncbi:MAG: hypothetical protein ACK4IS_08825 [Erythrobacter sp.]